MIMRKMTGRWTFNGRCCIVVYIYIYIYIRTCTTGSQEELFFQSYIAVYILWDNETSFNVVIFHSHAMTLLTSVDTGSQNVIPHEPLSIRQRKKHSNPYRWYYCFRRCQTDFGYVNASFGIVINESINCFHVHNVWMCHRYRAVYSAIITNKNILLHYYTYV